MKRIGMLLVPVLAALVIGVVVSAYPHFNVEDMVQEEKDLRIEMLEMKQEMIQNQLSYLKGEITQEEFEELIQENYEEIQPLREQMMEQVRARNPESSGCGGMKGFGGRGHRMIGWGV